MLQNALKKVLEGEQILLQQDLNETKRSVCLSQSQICNMSEMKMLEYMHHHGKCDCFLEWKPLENDFNAKEKQKFLAWIAACENFEDFGEEFKCWLKKRVPMEGICERFMRPLLER